VTTTALGILNPRDIPYCMSALRALAVPKVWLSYMIEKDAARAFNEAVQASDYDRYVLISDDCEPTQAGLDAVLALHDEGYPVATGYSNFDTVRQSDGSYVDKAPWVNLCWPGPLRPPPPGLSHYRFMMRSEVNAMPDGEPIVTAFTGLSFTCMSREMWLRFPATPCLATGGQMDYQLSYDLQQLDVPIVAAKGGFVQHVKDEWGVWPDKMPEKQLLVGLREPAVTWTDEEQT
jgi:hypothetical protein